MSFVLLIIQTQDAVTCDNHFPVAHSGFGERGGRRKATIGGVGAMPPAANEFLRFSHKKTLILAHSFIKKGCAVSAAQWTMQKYSRS